MQVNGVPPKGKELELFPGLTLHLPFGVAYARDEDGSMNLLKPRTSPKLYRDGPFELDDGAETTWKINSLRSLFSGTIEAPGPKPPRRWRRAWRTLPEASRRTRTRARATRTATPSAWRRGRAA